MPEDDTTAMRLQMLARALNLPIDKFFENTTAKTQDEVLELLRLWNTIKTDQDRAAALDFLRWIAVYSDD